MSMVREMDSINPIVPLSYDVAVSINGNNLEALQWILDRAGPTSDIWCGNGIRPSAYGIAMYTNPSLIPWLDKQSIIMTTDAAHVAVALGDLQVVIQIMSQSHRFRKRKANDPIWEQITAAATLLKTLDVARWLHERGYPFDSRSYKSAARHGRIKTLEWLREVGVVCDDWNKVRKSAVHHGQIEVLDWMVLNKLV